MSNIQNILSKEDCPLVLSILRSLYIETRPEDGHSNPKAVEERWQYVEEIVTQMAELIDPGCSQKVRAMAADESGSFDYLPF